MRAIKHVIWPRPLLYFPVGMLRRRGNVLNTHWDFFMGGYPRSANTFTQMAFLSTNPTVNLQTHRHVPTFVLQMVKSGIPGLVLIRKPIDAAVSNAISSNWSLERAVAYWNDYHETLLPVRSEIFLARFEDVTKDFGAVMRAVNARFGTSFTPFVHTPENTSRCFRLTEDICRESKGELTERHVCRPSKWRQNIKETCLDQMERSDFLQEELARANELYDLFVNGQPKEQRQPATEPARELPGNIFEAQTAAA